MKILCPYPDCNQRIGITESDGGTTAFCPTCGRQFECPSLEEIQAADKPEAARQETELLPKPPPPLEQSPNAGEASKNRELKIWASTPKQANRLCTDRDFLSETLTQDGSPRAREFLDAMDAGTKVVARLSPSTKGKGGFDVLLSFHSAGSSPE